MHTEQTLSKKFGLTSLALAISAAVPALASAEAVEVLPKTEVNAQTEDGYKVDELSSSKLTQPLVNTPRTVNVIPASVLQDQGVTSLNDALRNVAGVSTFGGGEGGGGVVTVDDKVTIRGFDARNSIYTDGVRDIAGYSRDMFNFESVEVFKGPGGSVAGKSQAGGSVNLVTKRARMESFNQVSAAADQLGTRRLGLDYNAQLSETVAGRVNAVYSDGGDRFDNGVENYETTGLAGSLLFQISEATSATLNAFYMTQDNTPMLGMPFLDEDDAAATGLAYGALPESMWDNYYGVRGRDYEEVDTTTLTLIVDHQVSENVALRSQTRWGANENSSLVGRPSVSGATVALSSLQLSDEENQLFTTAFDGIFQLERGNVRQDIVVGVEFAREQQDRAQLSNGLIYLDADGNPIDSPVVILFDPAQDIRVSGSITRSADMPNVTADNWAVYAFDTVKFGEHWQVDVNGRYDSYEMEGDQFVSCGRGCSNWTEDLSLDSDFFSWGASLSYLFNENANVYIGFADANEPPGADLAFGSVAQDEADPETAESYEIGGKWQTADQRLLLSAAYFVIERSVLDTDENGNPFIGGRQESKGFEFSAVGQVTEQLSLTASFTSMEAKITRSSNENSIGNGLAAAPDETASLWAQYQALNGRLSLGAGLNHSSGDTYWRQNRAYFETGSFTEARAMGAYQLTDATRVQVNVDNLTNEVYVQDYSARGHFLPNTPRSVRLSLSHTF